MENTIEYCTGRISAFAEIKALLSYVYTSDKNTVEQLKILTQHIEKQIELDEHHINCKLELMEGRAVKEVIWPDVLKNTFTTLHF